MTFDFYAALSIYPDGIREVFRKLEEEYGSLAPVENIMFTPISQSENSIEALNELSSSYDANVMFDSGGYEVQVGNIEFDDLYSYLIEFYNENRWGQRYVLPDNVPLSDDPPDLVEQKVKETKSASEMCFRRIPDELKPHAVAVTQGHTKEQISVCIEKYSSPAFDGLNHIGFGSFATGGTNNGVNMLTQEAFEMLEWAVKLAHDAGLTVHAFGIGGPTSLPLLHEAGVDTFDSTSWMRSGGYGNVFFPFKSRFNATHRKSRGGDTLTSEDLPHLKAETNHECPFCAEIHQLRENRWDRILHNLIVIHEMTNRIPHMDYDEILNAMNDNSRYRKRLKAVTTVSAD